MKKFLILFISIMYAIIVYGQSEVKRLSLNEAIETGLKNNPEIKAASKNIAAAKARFWSGISLPQPEVGVSYEYAPLHSSLHNFGERTLEVSQTLEFPTNYFLRGRKFNIMEEIAINQLDMIKQSVTRQIKTSYYQVLAKQNQVKFAEENLKISKDFDKKTEIRLNVGEGTNLERLTARVQYTEAYNNLQMVKNELSIAFAELAFALGFGKENYGSNFFLTDSLAFIEYKLDYKIICKLLEEKSPLIKNAELNHGITSVDKNLALSSLLPNMSLAYFRQNIKGSNGFYGASFGISVPLWFLFEQRGQIQEAVANQSISASELQFVKIETELQLKSACADYENNLRQVKLYLDEILPQAGEIYRIATKSFDAGELSYLEFLQAKQTLINSRNNYMSTLLNYYQSVFRIEEIVGQNTITGTGSEE
ncbi:MAG TPA: TolC family protein [bacterium]|nr:TolC family protein [bacterium]HPN46233.1 TolC family protein [bacterium]